MTDRMKPWFVGELEVPAGGAFRLTRTVEEAFLFSSDGVRVSAREGTAIDVEVYVGAIWVNLADPMLTYRAWPGMWFTVTGRNPGAHPLTLAALVLVVDDGEALR